MARKMDKTADDQYMGGSKNTQKGHNYNKPKAAAKTAPKPRPKPAQAKKAAPPKPRAKPAQAKKAPKSGQPRNITPETSAKPNRDAKGSRIDAGLTKRSVAKKATKPAAKKAAPRKPGGPATKPRDNSVLGRIKRGARRVSGKEGGIKAGIKAMGKPAAKRSTVKTKPRATPTRKRGVGKAGPASTSLRKRNYSNRG